MGYRVGKRYLNGNHSNLLLGIQERLAWDMARLEKVVRSLETERCRFTADDVITMFHKLTKESSLFTFMHGVIAQLKQLGKVRTSETYTATLKSFMAFRDEQDVPLDGIIFSLSSKRKSMSGGNMTMPCILSIIA